MELVIVIEGLIALPLILASDRIEYNIAGSIILILINVMTVRKLNMFYFAYITAELIGKPLDTRQHYYEERWRERGE